jgi:serine/threonine protein kinase/tetratricopeptide (TPR) repeat protein
MTPTTNIAPSLWPKVRSAFDALLDAPPDERAERIDRLAGEEPAVREALVSLLAAHEALESGDEPKPFLEDEGPRAALLATPLEELPEATSLLGRTIDGYRIVGRLGEGGMGIVYEAEQASPRRRVALKVIRGGASMDRPRLRAFQREAEALARLTHPGIAPIHDAGVTDDGRPYFVMELVNGIPLDRHIHERMPRAAAGESSIRARLRLFLEIGEALTHAHQQGIIHRDLKPSNILVVEDDTGSSRPPARSRIKLLDFGLARFLDAEHVPGLTTSLGSSLQGTIQYMSPEQARANPESVDSRSDVYTLGLILYEMLTDTRPFELDRGDLLETLHRICHEPPPRPRARNPKLDPDLETIVLKALQKEPALRYQGVSALCDDIGRYLSGLPIEARPATLLYQLGKIVRKHRAAAFLSGALALSLLAGAIGTTIGMIRARREAARARVEAETAGQIADFMEELFRVSNPSQARANSITARELLDAGVARIDTSLANQPDVKARLLGVMGEVYRGLGLYAESRPLLANALALRRAGPDSAGPQVARLEFALGGLLRRTGEYDSARVHYARSLELRRHLFGDRHPDVAASLTGLANVAMETGDYRTAKPLYEECIAIIEATKGPDHPDLALYLSNLALLHRATNDYAEALPIAERAVNILESSVGPEHFDLAYDLRGLGSSLLGLGRHAEARRVLRRTLAIQEKALGPDHADVGETFGAIGDSYLREGGHADSARVAIERSVSIFTRALGPGHGHTIRTRDNLSVVLRQEGRFREAIELSEACVRDLAIALGPGHPSLIIVYEHLGQHHAAAGTPAPAREAFEKALAMADTTYDAADEGILDLRRSLAEACHALGLAERARRLYADITVRLGPDSAVVQPTTVTAWSAVFDRAAELHREAGLADSARMILGWKAAFEARQGGGAS